MHYLERELFLRELAFLKRLKRKVMKEDRSFTAVIEDEIYHLEQVLEETET